MNLYRLNKNFRCVYFWKKGETHRKVDSGKDSSVFFHIGTWPFTKAVMYLVADF